MEFRGIKNPLARLMPALLLLAGLTVGCVGVVAATPVGSAGAASCTPGSTSAAYGTDIFPGSCWLGGQGVDVYSNGEPDGSGSYQCVELVTRLYATLGWTTTAWPSANGDQLWDNHPSNLISQANGSISYLNPGDAVSMEVKEPSGTDEYGGHVGVVNSVSAEGGGLYSLQLVNENATTVLTTGTWNSSNGTISMTPSGSWTYPVNGVVHAPTSAPPPPAAPRPAAVINAAGTNMNVFYNDGGNLVNEYWVAATGWHYQVLASGIVGDPAAVINSTGNNMNVFYEGNGGNLVNEFWNSATGWDNQVLASGMAGDPAAVINSTGNNMNVFYEGNGGNLVNEFWNSATGWDNQVLGTTFGPSFTSGDSATMNVGEAGSIQITSTGDPNVSWSFSGSLPLGVSFVGNGDDTASLAGTPAAGTAGIYALTITASNGVGSPATQSFTLTVDQAPAITSPTSATFIEGNPSSFTAVATGYPTPALTETGALPSGVTFTGGVFSGTPTEAGTFPISITASNGVSPDANQSFTLAVGQTPAITSTASATFTKGVLGTFTPAASGFPGPTITEAGPLPTGVTFTAGTLRGKSTVIGTFPITFTAHNGIGIDATQHFTLKVLPIEITTTSLPSGKVGAKYSTALKAVGGNPPYSWSLAAGSKPLPPGLKLSSTGMISGTPTKKGTYSFTVKVVDTKTKTKPVVQHTATKTLTIVIT